MITVIINIAYVLVVGILLYLLYKEKKTPKSDFYVDYTNGKYTLRVFRIEHEYQATVGIPHQQLLDTGSLDMFHRWVLIDTNDKNKLSRKRKVSN